jgi:hypothetical protein
MVLCAKEELKKIKGILNAQDKLSSDFLTNLTGSGGY